MRWHFPMIAFINSNKGEGEAYSIKGNTNKPICVRF